jgi:formamidopyrimidine-DNA glycosylase
MTTPNGGCAMPELPEVETVRRGLAPRMEGAVFGKPDLRRAGLRFPFQKGFARRLTGRSIVGLDRRAKYLVARLDDGTALSMHLGMTGSFRMREPGVPEAADVPTSKHDHVVFPMTDSAGVRFDVVYNDPRRFGYMDLVDAGGMESHPRFRGLGVEPLSKAMSAKAVAPLLAARSGPIKTVLLDQRVIAGLGNIYVCEALWRAHVDPSAPASSLVGRSGKPSPRLVQLVRHIREVLEQSIVAGGSTLKDYRKADGSRGSFQEGFAVYGREGSVCSGEGCVGTVMRTTHAGRSTFHCDVCQTF